MALYTEACTVVRTTIGLSESFKVKVGLHQGSLLSPLLFAGVMDAAYLVLMASTMEQLDRRGAEWRASILDKGLKVNTGKYKVMVDSSGGKMIVNSGKWLVAVCWKGV